MSVAATLAEARKLIAQGWTQGTFRNGERGKHCYCLAGAVVTVNIPNLGALDAEAYADSPGIGALSDCLGRRVYSVYALDRLTEWNDAPDRTQEDVLALIDRAIAKEAKA